MILSADAAALLWSSLDVLLMGIIIAEFVIHHQYNGPILKALISTLLSMLLVLFFPFLARLDAMMDISPGWNLKQVLAESVWCAYAILFIALVCMWWSLHTEHARRKEKKP